MDVPFNDQPDPESRRALIRALEDVQVDLHHVIAFVKQTMRDPSIPAENRLVLRDPTVLQAIQIIDSYTKRLLSPRETTYVLPLLTAANMTLQTVYISDYCLIHEILRNLEIDIITRIALFLANGKRHISHEDS